VAVAPSNRPPHGRRHPRKLFCFAFPVITPPPLVSFSSLDLLLRALPDSTRERHEREIRALHACGLPPAISLQTVSTLFGVSAELIGAMARGPRRYYRIFPIRKGKKTRQIEAPRVALKIIQRWIGHYIARSWPVPPCVFGFVSGKSTLDAAAVHCGACWVYSLDLRDFFPSINGARLQEVLQTIGYSAPSAAFMCQLLTIDGRLPQGSPASPVLSNLAFQTTDNELSQLAAQLRVRYTRYADDLVFSSSFEMPDQLIQTVQAILLRNRWTIATDKEHVAKQPARLKVHGLLVNGSRPRLTKGYRNRIRAFAHLQHAGRIVAKDRARILGHLAHASHVSNFGQLPESSDDRNGGATSSAERQADE
jgi:RNA-directed DNA polymerase